MASHKSPCGGTSAANDDDGCNPALFIAQAKRCEDEATRALCEAHKYQLLSLADRWRALAALALRVTD